MENTRYFKHTMSDHVTGTKVQIDDKYWKQRIDHIVTAVLSNMPPTIDHCKGGLYVGCAGVAYMFYYMACSDVFGTNSARRRELLDHAKQYITVAMTYTQSSKNRDQPTAFLHGDAGVCAVSSLIFHALGDNREADKLKDKYLSLSHTVQSSHYGADELFVGRSGYLCGLIALKQAFEQGITNADIDEVAEAIIKSGRRYSQKHHSPCPLMYAYHEKEYLGAAHGLTSVLQMLMSCPNIVRKYEADLRTTIDFMMSLMQDNGNIASSLEKALCGVKPSESKELVHWCHGASGAVHLFARASLMWSDDKYLDACKRNADLVWQKGLLRKGPGICHGVSGSGYVFLLLYRLTSEEKYLQRALRFAEFMQSAEFAAARTPDRPYSLFEGLAGTACFLTDLMQPQRAEFPLFKVFL